MTLTPIIDRDYVNHCSSKELLAALEQGSVEAIVTSPPYSGLPGRGNTMELVEEMLDWAVPVLHPEYGTVTLIVGSAPGHPLLPFQIATSIEAWTDGALVVDSTYVWDRTGTLDRKVGAQNITHDHIIHCCRAESANVQAIAPSSVVRSRAQGFNYGLGVTTPPDLAAIIVAQSSEHGDLVVDPFAGLGEIGVQAVHQGRRFLGSDLSPAAALIACQRIEGTEPA